MAFSGEIKIRNLIKRLVEEIGSFEVVELCIDTIYFANLGRHVSIFPEVLLLY